MALITVTEQNNKCNNIFYLQNEISQLFTQNESGLNCINKDNTSILQINISDENFNVVKEEVCDKVAEILVVNYKYVFLKNNVNLCGLSTVEKELLLTSLIAADLDDDKHYVFDKIKNDDIITIDGVYNFRLKQLRKKWEEIITYIPNCFVNSQLKEFVRYLIDNKSKKTYIDNGKVYDSHYKRLNRCELLCGISEVKITREVLLSNCGSVSLAGAIPKEDEFYLNEFFSDKLTLCDGYFC